MRLPELACDVDKPAFAHLGYGRGSLPVTERLCDEVITLPMFPELGRREVERVIAACESLPAEVTDTAEAIR